MDQKFIDRFDNLCKIDGSTDKLLLQQRGYDFEAVINDIFADEKSLLRRSYHTKDNKREQIDGAIEVWNRVLLIEVKWVKSNLAASELYSFIGKVENKFHGSLGVFISRNELTDNFIRSLNTGRRQNVIVIHGNDIDELFKPDSPPITKYIEHCIKLLSYDNLTHYPFSDFAKGYKPPEELAHELKEQERIFIANYLNNVKEVEAADLGHAYYALNQDIRNSVYRYVLDSFDYIWFSRFNNLRSQHPYNYLEYWRLIGPRNEEVRGTEKDYFSKKLLSDFQIYGLPEIFRLYKDKYQYLDIVTKEAFERSLLKQFEEARKVNYWELENAITDIVKELWDDFQKDTIEGLKDIYIHIYMDIFVIEIFSQKQFANKLLEEHIITEDELRSWFEDKLISFISSKHTIVDAEIEFFWRSYDKISHLMGFADESDYIQYVKDKSKEYINAKKAK